MGFSSPSWKHLLCSCTSAVCPGSVISVENLCLGQMDLADMRAFCGHKGSLQQLTRVKSLCWQLWHLLGLVLSYFWEPREAKLWSGIALFYVRVMSFSLRAWINPRELGDGCGLASHVSSPQDSSSEIGAFSTSSSQIWVPFIYDRDAVPAMSLKKEVFPSRKIEINAFVDWWRKLEIKGWRTLPSVGEHCTGWGQIAEKHFENSHHIWILGASPLLLGVLMICP